MSFLNERLPVDVAPGAGSSPTFSTNVKRLRGGGEYRNALWSDPLRSYRLQYPGRDAQRIEDELLTFLMKTQGSFRAFRARDWSDYKVTDAPVATGDGVTYWFRLYKPYDTYSRRISLPVAGSVSVKLNGSLISAFDYAIDSEKGVIVFINPPAPGVTITWSGEFDVPVRFEDDGFEISMVATGKGVVSGVSLIEVRRPDNFEESEFDDLRDVSTNPEVAALITLLDALEVHVNVNWRDSQ